MWGRTGDANGDAQPGAHDLSRLAYRDCLWGPARVGRPYAHEQVDMIGLDSQFQNVSPFIGALLTNKRRTIFSNRAGQDWLAALGYLRTDSACLTHGKGKKPPLHALHGGM